MDFGESLSGVKLMDFKAFFGGALIGVKVSISLTVSSFSWIPLDELWIDVSSTDFPGVDRTVFSSATIN